MYEITANGLSSTTRLHPSLGQLVSGEGQRRVRGGCEGVVSQTLVSGPPLAPGTMNTSTGGEEFLPGVFRGSFTWKL